MGEMVAARDIPAFPVPTAGTLPAALRTALATVATLPTLPAAAAATATRLLPLLL